MRFFTLLLLLSTSHYIYAQDYTSALAQWREAKHESLKKDDFSPVHKDQIQYLRYFAADTQYAIQAVVTPLFGEKKFRMPTYDGSSTEYIRHVLLTFDLHGKTWELTCYKNISLLQNPKYTNYLFIPFKDRSNGDETYEGGRYLELDASDIRDGAVLLDFNKSYNPYCAYSNGYRCPIPPQENHLETTIFAGEQKYQGPKNERTVNKNMAESFNESEKQLILSGSAQEKLPVYQITAEKEFAILKTVSKDIKPDDALVQILAKRMLATVQDPEHSGVGIAAPQIGINKNLIWVQRLDKKDTPFEFFINPKIIWRSKLMRKGAEGCLSIPDRREDIERNYAIRIQYWTSEGQIKEENVEGFTAVIFQHEIDHLYGILYPDRLEEQGKKELVPLQDKISFSIEKGNTLP